MDRRHEAQSSGYRRLASRDGRVPPPARSQPSPGDHEFLHGRGRGLARPRLLPAARLPAGRGQRHCADRQSSPAKALLLWRDWPGRLSQRRWPLPAPRAVGQPHEPRLGRRAVLVLGPDDATRFFRPTPGSGAFRRLVAVAPSRRPASGIPAGRVRGSRPSGVRPGGKWERANQTEFTVRPSGEVPGIAEMPPYLHGRYHADLFPACTFRVAYAAPGKFVVRIAQVAKAGARINVTVTAQRGPRRTFPPPVATRPSTPRSKSTSLRASTRSGFPIRETIGSF